MILDTTVIFDLLKGEMTAVAAVERAENRRTPIRLSAMTLYEIYGGIGYGTDAADEKREIEAIVGSKEIYDVSRKITRKAGRLAGELARRGEPLDDVGDEVVGATGVVHEEPVLTRNVSRFERTPGLEVESY
ncbi:PIN domain-containing protein [Halegenticoccus soli]|uniref:PIN domain-containing protein n=1 Tax=Halegenticoccus soli TaxID=1985678 RepID=UPI001179E9C4|nr:PIN domain-containing protein [Halegenticoccus soli]